MSRKLIAIGNVLMGDDGIAIAIAKKLEAELLHIGIEVIYMETDPYYGISMIKKDDDLILLDGAKLGNVPGEITLIPYLKDRALPCLDQHELHFLDLLQLYYTNMKGVIIAVEIAEVGFGNAFSQPLINKINEITIEVLKIISSL